MAPLSPLRPLLVAALAVGLSTTVGWAQSQPGGSTSARSGVLGVKKPFARQAGAARLRARPALAARLSGSTTAATSGAPDRRMSLAHLDSLVSITRDLLGVRYVWAGASPKGVDCSGLVQYAFSKLGFRLPHSAAALANTGEAVIPDTARMRPGDLIVFSAERSTRISHVGIYVGGGTMVHASTSKRRVIEVPFDRQKGLRVRGVRRILALGDSGAPADRF